MKGCNPFQFLNVQDGSRLSIELIDSLASFNLMATIHSRNFDKLLLKSHRF